MKRLSALSGAILYEGPSALDGAPIVVIATGLDGKFRNRKTGPMVQTWIMRADVAPHLALKSGEDASVCGDCMHRPANGGACYVRVFQAPLVVWKAWKRGVYPKASPQAVARVIAANGLPVRMGSYGDPAAAPLSVWRELAGAAPAHTGYTHQWRSAPQGFASLLMASVDSVEEGAVARAQGWRTFRVRTAAEPLAAREFICPASHEAGQKTTCSDCRACGGNASRAKASPVIVAHGATARRFELTRNGAAVAA